ncbi:hypothetical protein MKX08_001137 [Trichoderma sp. CBMAI-0020]|nr:hypothetical protein MKX08_001137 [Trichoderma sp. CBMAI-0020]
MLIIPTKTSHKKPYPAISPERAELSQAGRTILVTGGGLGIGFAICRAFIAAAAFRIIIVGRRTSVIDDAVTKLADITKSQGRDTIILGKQCDIADLNSSKTLWDQLAEEGIIVDALMLNAATQGAPGPILERGTTKVWQDLAMNVQSTIYFTERFHKQPGNKKKYLVNVSSAVIHKFDEPVRLLPSYSFTKNSAAFFLQQVALHVTAEEMQIVSFNPGQILTDAAKNAGFDETSGIDWDDENLPGHFAVWAASPEAKLLHGRFVWAHWDIDELLSGENAQKLKTDDNYLRLGVIGLA